MDPERKLVNRVARRIEVSLLIASGMNFAHPQASSEEGDVNPGRISWLGGGENSSERWLAYRGLLKDRTCGSITVLTDCRNPSRKFGWKRWNQDWQLQKLISLMVTSRWIAWWGGGTNGTIIADLIIAYGWALTHSTRTCMSVVPCRRDGCSQPRHRNGFCLNRCWGFPNCSTTAAFIFSAMGSSSLNFGLYSASSRGIEWDEFKRPRPRFLAGRRQIGRFNCSNYEQELFEGHPRWRKPP